MSDPQQPSTDSHHHRTHEHAHDDGSGANPSEERELRAVANLLRQLPDPEPPEGMRLRVMEQIHGAEARPRVLRGLFRSGRAGARPPGSRQPGIAAALAAGITGWVLLVSPQNELPGTSPAGLIPGAGSVSEGAATDAVTQVRRRLPASPFPSVAVAPPPPQAYFVSDGQLAQTDPPRTLPPLDRRLDRQIDQMLHQPDAFFRRLERIRENEHYLARLAERSARRGDSAAVALQVRNTQHPLAPKIAEQFLRASLAQSLNVSRSAAPQRSQLPAAHSSRPGAIYAH